MEKILHNLLEPFQAWLRNPRRDVIRWIRDYHEKERERNFETKLRWSIFDNGDYGVQFIL